MGIEKILLDELVRFAPRPTLRQAKQAFKVYKIQNAAIEVAALMRDLGVELNTRRRELEKLPLNHRDFLVGSTAVGIVPIIDQPDRFSWLVSYAYNTKPHPNEPKVCAEKRNGRRLIRKGCTCAVGIAIVGVLNTNGDGRSGLHGPGPTLDMCEACRDDAHDEFRGLYCDDTLVINEHADTRARTKPRNIPEIFAHHGEIYWGSNPKVQGLHGGR